MVAADMVDVTVRGLPNESFTTAEFRNGTRIGTLHWAWKDEASTAAPPNAQAFKAPS